MGGWFKSTERTRTDPGNTTKTSTYRKMAGPRRPRMPISDRRICTWVNCRNPDWLVAGFDALGHSIRVLSAPKTPPNAR